MKKYHFVFDKTPRAKKLEKYFMYKYKNTSINKSNIIVVAGGDGFMLRVIKKYYKYKKTFYGINCGTFGFLMNRYSKSNLQKRILNSKIITINPIHVKITKTDKKSYKTIAINEISLLRQSSQTSKLKIKVNNEYLIKNLIGDGVLVSTPAGSTAYNLSIHGPILSLNSKKVALTPISPFRPRRWKGKIISDKSAISIENLEPSKRPVSAVADNNEIRNIKKIYVKVDKKIKLNLLFDKKNSLINKIRIEQIKKIN